MAPRETENDAYAKLGVTNKEHYGMLWYFLEWSIETIRFSEYSNDSKPNLYSARLCCTHFSLIDKLL